MTTASERLRRRRARVRALTAEGLSQRQVAAKLKISKGTVLADLKSERSGKTPTNAAKAGNFRALRHGAKSEQLLAPMRERHAESLRKDFPALDDRRVALLADRLARVQAASRWLDEQDGIVRDDRGEPYPILRELERWASRAEAALREVEEEHRQANRPNALADFEVADG